MPTLISLMYIYLDMYLREEHVCKHAYIKYIRLCTYI